jgi:hypothetical protein
VLHEQREAARVEVDTDEVERLDTLVASLRKREERLVRLFSYDDLDDDVVPAKLQDVQRHRATLTDEIDTLAHPRRPLHADVDEIGLRRACEAVAERLDRAGPEDHERVLEALQISARATREEVTVEGVLPIEEPDF